MKLLLSLMAVLLLECQATLFAQSVLESNPVSSPMINDQVFGMATTLPDFSSSTMSHYSFDSSGSGMAGLVGLSSINLNGQNITIDSYQPTAVPEPDSLLTLLVGSAMLAWRGLRRRRSAKVNP